MHLKPAVFFIFLFAFSFPVFSAPAPVDPDVCEDALSEKWISMLEDAKRAETYFMERKWHYLKYWETVYNAVWPAEIKKQDRLSDKRKAEGEVLYARYDRLAEDYLSLAEEADTELQSRLKSLRETMKSFTACCGAHEYRICMLPRAQDVAERVENLEKILDLRRSSEAEFSARIRASVQDRPSDHDDFASRYVEYLNDFEVKGSAKILFLFRELRNSLEVEWPGQKCCKLCNYAPADASQDELLSRVKPGDEKQTGLDGRIVNNASLLKAFDELEKKR